MRMQKQTRQTPQTSLLILWRLCLSFLSLHFFSLLSFKCTAIVLPSVARFETMDLQGKTRNWRNKRDTGRRAVSHTDTRLHVHRGRYVPPWVYTACINTRTQRDLHPYTYTHYKDIHTSIYTYVHTYIHVFMYVRVMLRAWTSGGIEPEERERLRKESLREAVFLF